MSFHVAQLNPKAEDLGQDKTLKCLIARFYWPDVCGDVRRWCAACCQATGTDCMRASLCVSPGGLHNAIPQNLISLQHLSTQCCESPLYYLPGWDPEKDPE